MTIINPKSIAGVTSITTPSGSDNLFTVHTNNTTERIRINNDGDVIVGSGITVSPDGDIFATGVTTATTFVGALTGNVTGNATGLSGTPNISVGTIAGSTGTFTGDVDIADKIVHTGDTNTAIRFPSTDTISFETNGGERARVTSGGRLGIGEDSPDTALHVKSADNILATFESTDADALIEFKDNSTSDTMIVGCEGGDNLLLRTDAGNIIFNLGNNSEKARFDSSGRLLIGTTTEGFSGAQTLTIAESGHSGITIRSGATSDGQICFSDATSGDGEYAGQIVYDHTDNFMMFRTNGGNERLRINSSGQVMIGTDTPTSNQAAQALTIALQNSGNTGLTLRSGTGGSDLNEGSIFFSDATSGAGEYAGFLQYSHASNYFRIGVNGTERTRINNVGEYLFGCTSTPNASVAGATIHCDPSPLPVYMTTSSRQHGANAYTHFQFFNTNGAVGQILISGSGTSYVTSSDYRLKENETAITDGITRLKQLKPYKFNFKADSSTVLDGFFAHEVGSVVPEATSGEKDAVATEDNVKSGLAENVGDIIPQGLDNAKLVPLLTSALQEAVTKIEVLETRLNNAGIAT